MSRLFLALGGLNAFLSVALGAFGAHALRAQLSPAMLEVYKTGVSYHQLHALALLAIGFALERHSSRLLPIAGWLLQAGILLFSGSLYLLAISGIKNLGIITPFGGLCLLSGWLLFSLNFLKNAPSR